MSDATAALTLTHPSRFHGRKEDVAFSLVAVTGKAKSWTLGSDAPPRVLLGQSGSCLVRVDDPSVSRRHAALDLLGPELELTDLSSTNGTFVNGVAIVRARLRGNEVIKIGDTKLRVIVEGAISPLTGEDHFGRVWGASVEMRRVFAIAKRLAPLDLPVLLEGEPGTGKGLLAEAIHDASARAKGPFIVATDPSELFGPGGLLEQAEGGTLVLDDITSFDLPTQTRLLSALERSDVRAIATTRKDVDRAVTAKTFKEELLLRFEGGRLELPPLHRRDGDTVLLIERIWSAIGGSPESIPYDLASETYPGNVRELEAAVVRRLIDPNRAPRTPASLGTDPIDDILAEQLPLSVARDRIVMELERRYVEHVLARTDNNVVRAAELAGVARRYFQILKARYRT